MDKTIQDLRTELFDVIATLKRSKSPEDIDRARAICEAAQVIVNSAKVECDFIKINDLLGTEFIPAKQFQAGLPRLIKGKAQSGS